MNPGDNKIHKRKVVIAGAGSVGATYAYALAQSGVAEEIVLIDRNEELLRGQVLDLVHGQPFFPTVTIKEGTDDDYADASLVVITAGAAQKPGETRLQLLQKNASIVGGIAEKVASGGCGGVMLIVTNPVDVMTYVAYRASGWPSQRVMGSGTVLDSARLKHFISQHCGVDPHSVHAYVLGEHGDSEFVAWSMTHVGGVSISDYCPYCKKCEGWKEQKSRIEQQVRDSAYHIIDAKGSTYFAVGLALVRITTAILRNQNSMLTVSVVPDGEYGLKNLAISIPSIISSRGIERIVPAHLPQEEIEKLTHSAGVIRKAIKEMGLG
ncbi:MAG: L-lactate dehydrogenase [Bacteroidales bacterium]|nr:L-lactate dehydrogenase [Bacteroidales bacterium]